MIHQAHPYDEQNAHKDDRKPSFMAALRRLGLLHV